MLIELGYGSDFLGSAFASRDKTGHGIDRSPARTSAMSAAAKAMMSVHFSWAQRCFGMFINTMDGFYRHKDHRAWQRFQSDMEPQRYQDPCDHSFIGLYVIHI